LEEKLKELEELLYDYDGEYLVKENFEEQVLSKINRKKQVRKVNYSILSILLLVVSVLVIQSFIPSSDTRNYFARGNKMVNKEEIPLVENFYFSTHDDVANFTLEQVSYTDDEGVVY
jgi:hypothetical protein